MNTFRLMILCYFAFISSGCGTTNPDIVPDNSQLAIRELQTRHYDTLDTTLTMRSVVATLQDLGFIIDAADPDLGLVTGTRLHGYTMRMTVTVAQKSNDRVSVRANARIDETGVSDPRTYQDFFVVLDKAMFLTLNQVD